MATDLVSLVMQFLTPDMIGRIATAFELDRSKAQPAVSSAVPALLAAFNDTATQPGGAQKLADAAGQQASTLRNFASALAAGGQSSLYEDGSRMLLSLVGAQNQNALTEAIATFTGLNQGATGSLLGILAPIIMGTIAQHQGTRGLDAKGIANLFASQRENIAAALPSVFGILLRSTNLLNSLGDATGMATAAGSEAMQEASATRLVAAAHQHGADAPHASSNWLYWLLAIAAVAALLIYFAATNKSNPMSFYGGIEDTGRLTEDTMARRKLRPRHVPRACSVNFYRH